MNIAVINTGGTISCVGDPLTPMTAANFAQACENVIDPILQEQFPELAVDYLTSVTFPESSTGTLDSTNLQPTDWCIMANAILSSYSQYDGWVILHGTDSMDFTGTALPFLLSSFSSQGVATGVLSKPIIITGSQIPMFYLPPGSSPSQIPSSLNYNTDAFQNLCGAVAAAQTGIPEVCIYFQNKLYRGNRSVKTNASEFKAFSSPNYPALAEYGIELTVYRDNLLPGPVGNSVSLDNAVVLTAVTSRLAYIRDNINSSPVIPFKAFPAAYDWNSPQTSVLANLISACVSAGIKGFILESYGEGNFPSGDPDSPTSGATYQALQSANNSGVVIVDCTQVLAGVVNDSAYAAGAWLPAVGALSPADMTPMTALAKLMILLTEAAYTGNNWTAAQVKVLLQMNLLGEMMSVNFLDSRINSTLLAGESISALDGSATLTNDPVQGPILMNESGNTPTQLWAMFSTAPSSVNMPGRLVMQNDGNLVYYSRYNAPMWATGTGNPNGASSMLMLVGSASASLTLEVYDYSGGSIASVLYPSS